MPLSKKGAKQEDTDNLALSTRELLGRQSVRATFRLPDQVIKLLKVAADHLGIKQKSLIDQLMENRETLIQIATEIRGQVHDASPRRQKTFVLSRNTLDLLDEISRQYDMSRDQLVELSINRLIPYVTAEEKKHRRRQLLLDDIDNYRAQGEQLLNKAKKVLDQEDQLRLRISKLMGYNRKHINQLRSLIKEPDEGTDSHEP